MNSIKKVYSLFNINQKKKLFFLLIIIFIVSIFDLIGIGAILPVLIIFSDPGFVDNKYILVILDKIDFLNKDNFLNYSIIFLLIIFISKTIASLILNFVKYRVLFSFYTQISDRLMRIYLNLSYSEFIKFRISEKSNTLKTEIEYFVLGVIDPILIICLEILTIILISSFLLVYDAGLLIKIFFFGIVITFLLAYFFSKKLKVIGEEKYNLNNMLQLQIFQGLQGVKDIKLSLKEKIFLDKFSSITNRMKFVSSSIRSIQEAPRLLIELFAVLCFILIIFININLEVEFSDIIVKLGIFAAASFRILPSLNRIVVSINSIKQSHRVIEIIYNDIKLEKKITNKLISQNKKTRVSSIEINNLTYSYPENNKLILDNLSLKINSGDYVGIYGKSGSGKSTFVDLFSGLLIPKSGEIFFDKKNVKDHSDEWKTKIGYVPQKIYLNNESIRENIAFGQNAEDINDLIIHDSIKKARLEDLIAHTPKGINSIIGENGVNLSGGQIQRLGIARSLYRDTEILIFDESTNSLDSETEDEFMEVVNKLRGEKTILFISHKVKVLEKCDKLFELKNKKLLKIK